MITKDSIFAIAEEFCATRDIFIVDIQISVSMVIDVEIDSMGSLSIEKCIELSRFIESKLDREVQDFELTVGTHSISDPFKVDAHYLKNIGRDVEILLVSGVKVKGELVSFVDNVVEVKYEVKESVEGKKKKVMVGKRERYSTDEIKSTKLIIKI